MRAGVLAGIAGLVAFLVAHHFWIVPIWYIAPLGTLVAASAGAAVGSAYAALLPRLPHRPWTAIAVIALVGLILLPAFVIAELRGPIFSMAGSGSLLVSDFEAAIDIGVGFLCSTASTGALVGWFIGRSRAAALKTALAGFALALGPGHNIPLLGGTPSAAREALILVVVAAVSAMVLVEGHARLARPSSSDSGSPYVQI